MPFRGKKITILTIELRSLGNIERKTGNEYGHGTHLCAISYDPSEIYFKMRYSAAACFYMVVIPIMDKTKTI